MKAISGKQLCKILERNGWVLARIRGSQYIYARQGNATILTAPVHADKDLKLGTLRKLLKDSALVEDDV